MENIRLPEAKPGKTMTEIEFAAFLVSRVCHDLVGPLGAVVNGLEVLEDERDATMRADAIRIVTASAEQALARLQFMRLAFGAAGSVGSELDLGETNHLICSLLNGGRTHVQWQPPPVAWPKDWAKLLMNGVLIGADCLPRGGTVQIETDPVAYGFKIKASGAGARISGETGRALSGDSDTTAFDARGIQPILTYKLAKELSARLTISPGTNQVEITAG